MVYTWSDVLQRKSSLGSQAHLGSIILSVQSVSCSCALSFGASVDCPCKAWWKAALLFSLCHLWAMTCPCRSASFPATLNNVHCTTRLALVRKRSSKNIPCSSSKWCCSTLWGLWKERRLSWGHLGNRMVLLQPGGCPPRHLSLCIW